VKFKKGATDKSSIDTLMIAPMNRCLDRLLLPAILAFFLAPSSAFSEASPRPLMRDFIGLNGHFQFKPELYRQTCRLVRNYHNINWDVAKPGDPITVPKCVNGVDWEKHVYGKWEQHGFEIDLCAMFGEFGEKDPNYQNLWEGQEEWTRRYGAALAKEFGPGSDGPVTSIEIGNEPGNDFDDELYRRLFIRMARGIREADPNMKIVTATATPRKADEYSKSLDETFSSEEIKRLYDVVNLHVYAEKSDGPHPWARSYPEDPEIDYLEIVDEAITWRDQHAPGKEIWITEFGYDAATPEAIERRTGWAKKLEWDDVTDLQQAQYLVRSLFAFAERPIDRAYIYFFNDSDKPSVHASSGLTRNFEPKPAFWAIRHLYETLGDYRFQRAIKSTDQLRVVEFTHETHNKPPIWVAWSPTGHSSSVKASLDRLPGKLASAVEMPASKDPARTVPTESGPNGTTLKLEVGESPIYLTFE